MELTIGHLDPWDTISGAQGRLRNLGYDPGPIDGALGPRTRSVVRAFQRARGLSITGDLDRNTLETLKETHGA
jgi:peptidoglycan hydrolase-like protein with peptidoglycan-binding domain